MGLISQLKNERSSLYKNQEYNIKQGAFCCITHRIHCVKQCPACESSKNQKKLTKRQQRFLSRLKGQGRGKR